MSPQASLRLRCAPLDVRELAFGSRRLAGTTPADSPEVRVFGLLAAQAPKQLRRAAGVTLVELVVSMSIIAVALVGTLEVVRIVGGASADPMVREQVAAIGAAHLNEILLKDFYDPDLGAGGGVCPPAEPARALYDNVCDYDGLDDSGVRDFQDNPIASLSAYRVRVNVDTSASLPGLSGPADLVRVDVRVTFSDNVDITVSGHRARL